ncbi:MAG TPA: class I adenylate-forming enzyme family protein [Candidatus Eisenbacteria bacterium]|nr:class I adenylate-forming enzyme family protein [Candidatus Eisenbacteria bacterium]
MSLADIARAFDQLAARQAATIAVRERDRSHRYDELRSWSEEISRTLSAYCRAPGQRVGLMMPNSAAYVAAFFGITRVGGIVAPLNIRYRTQELLYYLEDTGAAALIVPGDLVEQAREALARLDRAPALIQVDDPARCRVLAEGGGDVVTAPIDGSPPILLQYTSGSTGAPKRVLRTHAQLEFELERLAQVFDLSPDDRVLGAAPFTHVNGLVRSMMTSMFVGATLHTVSDFNRRAVLDLITRERITYFGSVAQMFVILADTPVRGDVDLSSLRIAFSASAPLLAADNRRFHERYGLYVRQLYGSTETGTISVNLGSDLERSLESVGRPLPGVSFRTVDDSGRDLAPGEEGEVVIKSPAAISSYPGNPEASAAAFREGGYYSGDLGRLAPDGSLTLTGRKKFLINRGGFKVNPLEVEEAIQSHPKVSEVVVVGAPGPHGDDLVRCVIVAASPCTPEEILLHCRGLIADYKIPSRIEFRDTLPRTDTGKLLRHQV